MNYDSPIYRFSLSIEMSRLVRDGTAEPVSRDQILKRERGQGIIHKKSFSLFSHEQDWQNLPCLVHTLAICVTIHTYIHTYIHSITVSAKPCRYYTVCTRSTICAVGRRIEPTLGALSSRYYCCSYGSISLAVSDISLLP